MPNAFTFCDTGNGDCTDVDGFFHFHYCFQSAEGPYRCGANRLCTGDGTDCFSSEFNCFPGEFCAVNNDCTVDFPPGGGICVVECNNVDNAQQQRQSTNKNQTRENSVKKQNNKMELCGNIQGICSEVNNKDCSNYFEIQDNVSHPCRNTLIGCAVVDKINCV